MPVIDFIYLPTEVFFRFLGWQRSGPWMSRAAVRELDHILRKVLGGKARVLEIGGGLSTEWIAERACQVTTIEDDERWVRKLQTIIDNSKLEKVILVKAQGLAWVARHKEELSRFNLIIIDGDSDAHRIEIARMISMCNPYAVLVLDNSDRYSRELLQSIFQNKTYLVRNGLIRNPLQVTETTFFV